VPRVRHHTDDAGLESIRARQAILPGRGVEGIEAGVHVEVEPFGTTRPGLNGPKAETGSIAESAFVEFDAPKGMFPRKIGPRNTAIIPTPDFEPLSLRGLNARFVKVRRFWWEFWRTRAEPAQRPRG
jgi:hypothetical protein